jgi:nucleotide-binding universal stress UspA family protein
VVQVGREVVGEPALGEVGHGWEGAGFFEEVGGARYDGEQGVGGREDRLSLPVEGEHDVVVAADDEQRRREHVAEVPFGEVGPAAPGHDGHVIYGPVVGTFPYDVAAIESAAHRLVDEVVADATASAPDIVVERAVVAGGAASSLLDAAKDADLLVVGRRGLGGFRRLLLGSVSDHVARHADTTVVVVPADRAIQ